MPIESGHRGSDSPYVARVWWGRTSGEGRTTSVAASGVIVRDPLVDEVVWGGMARVGTRSVQRRVAAATGLTQGAIRQIERAREAALLLAEDSAPLDARHRCGYYDQPHRARSLQRFIGRTATQLRRGAAPDDALSLLYKPDDVAGPSVVARRTFVKEA